MPAPTVTNVTPNSGPTAGGTPVQITGTNFTGANAVSFGGTAAQFTVNSATHISAASPAHAAGSVDVQVTNPDGTSPANQNDRFFYEPAVPTVTTVSPHVGPTAGGTPVQITGTNFSHASAVSFGGTAAQFTINSATQISAGSPAHAAGTVDVRVTNSDGTSAVTAADQFTYQ
jgi:hypothetical protein